MNNKCNAVVNSPNDDARDVTVGRRKEGVAILWNTKFDRYITPQKYDYDWDVSIDIYHDHKICIFLMSICHAITGRTRWNT